MNYASLFWFLAIVAMIPASLWLLKRSPMGRLAGGAAVGGVRIVASQPIAPHQRLLTVEVGQGAERRWLVLGVTAHNITALHSMAAAEPAPSAAAAALATPFAQVLQRLRRSAGAPDAP